MRNNSFMNNKQQSGSDSNAPFILIIALFIIVFVVVSYFLVSGSAFGSFYSDELKNNNNNNNNNNSTSVTSGPKEKEVYNIRDNIFTFQEAKAVCAAHGARLATIEEMIDAYKRGANWCSYGWSDGQLALYPTQKEYWAKLQMDKNRRKQCGEPGLNGGYFHNADFKFGANCFGPKPGPKGSEMEKNTIGKNPSNPYENMIDKYRNGMNDFRISPFSDDNWSNCA
jgi:hypothetical protein